MGTISAFQAPLSAAELKTKAKEFGADLVGIADGKVMDDNPPDPSNPKRPSDITDYDADRVIVLAKRLNTGTTRIKRWDERHKYYNDELAITALEETALALVLWLEDQGYPALIVPPTHVDPWRYEGDPDTHQTPLLSLEHAAVEAGLGTLGLNLQLLTPEFGPRVILSGVLSSVPVTPDERQPARLCLGPECGRCLSTCPADAVQHWDRDWSACDRCRSPHGFAQLTKFLGKVIDEDDVAKQKELLRTKDSFYIWQSILRGAGVVTGCRRCQDVCPVGADYAALSDALEDIPEDTPAKQKRLDLLRQAETAGNLPASHEQQIRWLGKNSD